MNNNLPLPKEPRKKMARFNGVMKPVCVMIANMAGAMHLVERHQPFGFRQSVRGSI